MPGEHASGAYFGLTDQQWGRLPAELKFRENTAIVPSLKKSGYSKYFLHPSKTLIPAIMVMQFARGEKTINPLFEGFKGKDTSFVSEWWYD